MIKSMTGYGRATLNNNHYTIELFIRSINSKTLDISFKIPEELQYLENALKRRLRKDVYRGKLEVRSFITYDDPMNMDTPFDQDALKKVHQKILQIKKEIPETNAPSVDWVAHEISTNRKSKTCSEDELWTVFHQALNDLHTSRAVEGKEIAVFLKKCCQDLTTALSSFSTLFDKEIIAAHNKILQHLESLENTNCNDLLKMEQKNMLVSNWLTKFDVAEELSRLASHLHTMQKTIQPEQSEIESPHGRRIEFFIQEMGREANTLLSKTLTAETAKSAIDIKLIIEKMKEQVQNVE